MRRVGLRGLLVICRSSTSSQYENRMRRAKYTQLRKAIAQSTLGASHICKNTFFNF